ncbi:MAG TPA: hypothetical protein VHO24_00875 [Opitutaceae bacterium]|nr:hypothetical protein [Opitutaceae bacterium]
MTIQEVNALHILHVFSAIGLVGSVFYAAAAGPETKKALMRWSGVVSLLVVLTGIRMWQGMYQFQGVWPVVKIVCWLALSAFAGLAYKRREKAGLWIMLALLAAAISLVMVYLRPF